MSTDRPATLASPTVPISAELLYRLSLATGALGMAVLDRMSLGRTEAERRANAEPWDQLEDQALAVLTEHAGEWLSTRADQRAETGDLF